MPIALLLTCVLTPRARAESLTPIGGTKPSYEPAQSGYRPVWSAGAFLKIENNESISPEIQTFDPEGHLLLSATFKIPNANLIHIRGFARANDGTVAVGGFSNADDGRIAAFFAWVAPDGDTVNVTRCEPFYPVKMAIGSDGSLWTVGYVNAQSVVPDPDPKAGVVRHFDRAGRWLNSYVPRTTLDDGSRIPTGHLVASKSGVGWISTGAFSAGKALPGEYMEISPDGTVGKYPLPPNMVDATSYTFGFALTDAGAAFANIEVGSGDARSHSLFVLNRARRLWDVVNVPGVPSLLGSWLYGASGNILALRTAASPAVRFYEVAN